MPEFLDGYPLAIIFPFFVFGAMSRGQLLYWLGRGVRVGARRLNLNLERGRAVINKWGLVAIPFAYLTVGLQSLILAAAGAMHIGWGRFTLACVPGAIAWAAIYSTIGWAVWRAIFFDGLTSPWTWIAIVVLAAVGYGLHRTWRTAQVS